jgi:quercetin 2,3-dioxygenase
MIELRKASDRHHDESRKQDVWLTFYRGEADGFGALETFDEDHLRPGARIPRGRRQRRAEVVTYVREGALTYEDSMGRSGVVHAGEFQRIAAEPGIRHSEMNASRSDEAHFFQIGLRASQAALEAGHQQKRFSVAERRGVLCVVASTDARRGSLRLSNDALIHSALLHPGQHPACEVHASVHNVEPAHSPGREFVNEVLPGVE